ncbi:MAG TPA: 50S ribosomal protein L15 [Chthonomonadaceae bacterium]|jgi:large subunit ribosomal protein L15|nr:50S ribosomal protein L15 [Chthonomonadaceae bacterium]
MPIGLHNLKPADGATHRAKRVGRGIGSGHGKTSGRGNKGNKARGQVNPNFEGGQTPLHRRLPQLRGVRSRNPHGFKNLEKRKFAVVNLSLLEANFEAGAEITPETLIERGLVRDLEVLWEGKKQIRLKILGDGEITKKFTVHAHRFSQSAQEKLQAAGGTAEFIQMRVR